MISYYQDIVEIFVPSMGLLILFFLLEFLLKTTKLLAVLEPSTGHRLENLDGLRAFLALGVVICHVGTFYYFYHGRPWEPHPNPYFRQAGAGSVRIFFMITGFLFWSKAIRKGAKLDFRWLFPNRMWRIMPLYLMLVLLILLISVLHSHFELTVPLGTLVREVAGLMIPGVRLEGSVNGFVYTEYVRPTWTLLYELIFYAVLPIIAIGAKNIKTFAVTAIILVGLTVGLRVAGLSVFDLSTTANFLVGMCFAHVLQAVPEAGWIRRPLVSAVALVGLAAAPYVIQDISPYLGNILYALVFGAILYGNSFFGVLNSRSASLLGEISYSIYLMHMPVLVLFYKAINSAYPIRYIPEMSFLSISNASLFAVVALALVTFRFIERYGIDRSKPSATVPDINPGKKRR